MNDVFLMCSFKGRCEFKAHFQFLENRKVLDDIIIAEGLAAVFTDDAIFPLTVLCTQNHLIRVNQRDDIGMVDIPEGLYFRLSIVDVLHSNELFSEIFDGHELLLHGSLVDFTLHSRADVGLVTVDLVELCLGDLREQAFLYG